MTELFRKTKGECPIHGEFTQIEWLDIDNNWIPTGCPKCREEAEAKRKAEMVMDHSDPICAKLENVGVPLILLKARFSNFTADTESLSRAVDLCQQLSHGLLQHLTLFGPTGIGKTHLAVATMADKMEKSSELKCGYTTELTIFTAADEARKKSSKRMLSELWDYWSAFDFLVIDEIQATPWELNNGPFMAELIDRRYSANKSTLLLTNDTPEQFKAHFEDKTISRLKWRGRSFQMTGDDWRAIHGRS
jgi:DNA replication protein